MEKDITIFICENKEISDEIIDKYLGYEKVTYAGIVPKEKRKKIVESIEEY